jgi:hypothetical protein
MVSWHVLFLNIYVHLHVWALVCPGQWRSPPLAALLVFPLRGDTHVAIGHRASMRIPVFGQPVATHVGLL